MRVLPRYARSRHEKTCSQREPSLHKEVVSPKSQPRPIREDQHHSNGPDVASTVQERESPKATAAFTHIGKLPQNSSSPQMHFGLKSTAEGFVLHGTLDDAPAPERDWIIEEWRILDSRGTILYSHGIHGSYPQQRRFRNGLEIEVLDAMSMKFHRRPRYVQEALCWMTEGTILLLQLPCHLVADLVTPTSPNEIFFMVLWIPPSMGWNFMMTPDGLTYSKTIQVLSEHMAPLFAIALSSSWPAVTVDASEEIQQATWLAAVMMTHGVSVEVLWALRTLLPLYSNELGAQYVVLSQVIVQTLRRRFQLTWSEETVVPTTNLVEADGSMPSSCVRDATLSFLGTGMENGTRESE